MEPFGGLLDPIVTILLCLVVALAFVWWQGKNAGQ
jgi:hypothetical protein